MMRPMKSRDKKLQTCDRCDKEMTSCEVKLKDGTIKKSYRPITTSAGERICENCVTCESCHNVILDGPKYKRGKMVRGVFLKNGRKKSCKLWFCRKPACIEAMKTNPAYLERKRIEKERNLKAENFEYDNGFKKAVRVNPFMKALMCPTVYGIGPDTVLVSNRSAMTMVLGMFHRIVNDRTVELTPSMLEFIMPEADDRTLELLKERNDNGSYDYLKILKLIQLMQGPLHYDLVDRKAMDECLYINSSLYHIARSVNRQKPIDGLQDMILQLMRRWWELGFYPRGRKDYLDIRNDWLLKILTQRLQSIPIVHNNNGGNNNNAPDDVIAACFNAQETECVVCLGEFDKLVMTDCRHRLTCEDCSSKLSKCPVCMKPIFKRALVAAVPE